MSQMREIQVGFGVANEGDLVSEMRGLPFCGSGGSKSRLAKAAGAETSGQMRNEKLHAVVARSIF